MMSNLFGSLVRSTLLVTLSQPTQTTPPAELVLLNAKALTVPRNGVVRQKTVRTSSEP
jgi:hypothetical protein